MKALKMFGIGMLTLIAALTLIAFFLPPVSIVTRSREIKAPPRAVFNMINDLHHWKEWSPWSRMDTAMKMNYTGPQAGAGAGYSWDSQNPNVGAGNLVIIRSIPYDSISTRMNFGKMGTSYAHFKITGGEGGQTSKVSWTLDCKGEDMSWLWMVPSRYFNLFMDDMIGPDFERGLAALEQAAQSHPIAEEGKVIALSETKVKPFYYISLEARAKMSEIGPVLGRLYGELQQKLQLENLQMAGPPMAMYPDYKPGDPYMRVVAMMPTHSSCKGTCSENMQCGITKEGTALVATFQGPYDKTEAAYDTLMKVMEQKKLKPAGNPYEEYVNDPAEVKSPADYLTRIYWPVH
jgi:effector-binding domain-containing protein